MLSLSQLSWWLVIDVLGAILTAQDCPGQDKDVLLTSCALFSMAQPSDTAFLWFARGSYFLSSEGMLALLTGPWVSYQPPRAQAFFFLVTSGELGASLCSCHPAWRAGCGVHGLGTSCDPIGKFCLCNVGGRAILDDQPTLLACLGWPWLLGQPWLWQNIDSSWLVGLVLPFALDSSCLLCLFFFFNSTEE